MAETYTSNLGLTKPDYDSPADISVINSNMDKIDNAVANAGGVKSVNGKTPDSSGAVTLGAEDVGALHSDGTAANAIQLNGKSADQYMLKTDTAVNSAKLGGKAPEEYASTETVRQLNDDKLGKTETASDSTKLGGVAASEYATHTDVSTAITDALNAIRNASGVSF